MKQLTCPHCADTYPDFDVAHVCSRGPYAPRLKPQVNERIKQLAEKATVFVADYDGQRWQIDPEKFAELIVAECIGIVSDAVDHREPASTYVNKIKQHFGVEE